MNERLHEIMHERMIKDEKKRKIREECEEDERGGKAVKITADETEAQEVDEKDEDYEEDGRGEDDKDEEEEGYDDNEGEMRNMMRSKRKG